jgi:hypothetical protein
MVDEWPIIEKKIHSFDMVFERVSVAGEVRVQEEKDELDTVLDLEFGEDEEIKEKEEEGGLYLSPDEMEIYQLVDGESKIREITYKSRFNEFETAKILYDLLSRHLIQDVTKAAPEEAEAAAVAARRPAARRHTMLTALGYIGILLLCGFTLTILRWNPLSIPKGLTSGPAAPVDGFLLHMSKARLDRIDYALQVHQLSQGSYPERLHELVEAELLQEPDLLDPWGRTYTYNREDGSAGYILMGTDSEGQGVPRLIISRTGS